MGAEIEGAGTSTIHVAGGRPLHGVDHEVIADRIEAGTYLIMGAATGGRVRPSASTRRTSSSSSPSCGRWASRSKRASGASRQPRRPARPGRHLHAAAPGLRHRPAGADHGAAVARRRHVDRHGERLREPVRGGGRAQPAGRGHQDQRPPRRDRRAADAERARSSRRRTCAAARRSSPPVSSPTGVTEMRGVYHIERGYEDLTGKLRARRGRPPRRRASREPSLRRARLCHARTRPPAARERARRRSMSSYRVYRVGEDEHVREARSPPPAPLDAAAARGASRRRSAGGAAALVALGARRRGRRGSGAPVLVLRPRGGRQLPGRPRYRQATGKVPGWRRSGAPVAAVAAVALVTAYLAFGRHLAVKLVGVAVVVRHAGRAGAGRRVRQRHRPASADRRAPNTAEETHAAAARRSTGPIPGSP